MPGIDVDAVRAATPGCHDVAFLNNAGAALPTQETLDAVIAHLRLEAEVGGYLAAARAGERIDAAREAAARLLHANTDEIALVGSDSQAWMKAFWGLVIAGGLRAGDRVVVDRLSYSSHYLALLQAERLLGFEIVVVPSTAGGGVDLDALAGVLDERARLVTATHVGTNCGLVNPVAEVGRLARAADVPFFLDACQSVGQIPLDLAAIGCDVATMTGRKFLRAPRGTGLLFVRRDFLDRVDPPGIDSASASWVDARSYELPPSAARFEEFEMSIAAKVGLAMALEQVLALGIESIHARVTALAERLRSGLAAIDRVSVEDGPGERSAITTFRVDGLDAPVVVGAAAAAGVTITVSNAPWARLDMSARGLEEVVRASPHCYNTEDEVDRLVGVVADLA